MAIKVKNLMGTGDKKCTCTNGDGTWLTHWKLQKGSTSYCKNTSCFKAPTLGGHVKKVDSYDNNHYITPLCDSCNKLTDEFYVPDDALVTASCK